MREILEIAEPPTETPKGGFEAIGGVRRAPRSARRKEMSAQGFEKPRSAEESGMNFPLLFAANRRQNASFRAANARNWRQNASKARQTARPSRQECCGASLFGAKRSGRARSFGLLRDGQRRDRRQGAGRRADPMLKPRFPTGPTGTVWGARLRGRVIS